MTELGVYILGAVALVILAAAGIAAGNSAVVLCAVISSGAAYVSQLGAAMGVLHRTTFAVVTNAAFMLIALGVWAYGVLLLS